MAMMDMYGPTVFPDPLMLSLADHMHGNLNQHNTFLGAMAHRKPNQKKYPNHLDVDISDNETYYTVDLEVPGIKNPNAVALNWTSWRSLVVSGSTSRPWNPHGSRKHSHTSESGTESEGGANDPEDITNLVADATASAASEDEFEMPPWLILGERRIGSFRREFCFPVDVDMEKLSARSRLVVYHGAEEDEQLPEGKRQAQDCVCGLGGGGSVDQC